MIIILGWIIGVLLIVGGLYWLPFLRRCDPLIQKEIELMRRRGKFENEPDYMQTFRVANSEGDLMANRMYIKLCKIAIVTGGIILSALTIKAIVF